MSLTDDLLRQLQGQPLEQMSSQLGLSQSQTAGAVSAALPLLLGALGRNASQPQGAQALFGALQRDHAGAGSGAGAGGLDIGSVLGAVLGGGASRQTDGAGILGHIFGDRQETAAQGLGQATGLGGSQASTLLKILAPIVLSYLAQRMFSARSVSASSRTAAPAACSARCWIRTATANSVWAICSRSAAACWVAAIAEPSPFRKG